jgi:hypothetical protein
MCYTTGHRGGTRVGEAELITGLLGLGEMLMGLYALVVGLVRSIELETIFYFYIP